MTKTKQKFYVVWKGRKPGIYKTWDECKSQTDGFAGAIFKSFPSASEAETAFARKPKEGSKTNGKPSTAKAKSISIESDAYAIFCDGGCDPNPGPSGTGMAVYMKGQIHEHWCGRHESEGSNNRAELFGILESLNYTKMLSDAGQVTGKQKAIIYCDSQYAINCVTKWSKAWRKNGWRTKNGDPVRNQEIVEAARQMFVAVSDVVEIRKVKGHSGVEGNELADQLAGIARARKMQGWSLTYTKEVSAEEA